MYICTERCRSSTYLIKTGSVSRENGRGSGRTRSLSQTHPRRNELSGVVGGELGGGACCRGLLGGGACCWRLLGGNCRDEICELTRFTVL